MHTPFCAKVRFFCSIFGSLTVCFELRNLSQVLDYMHQSTRSKVQFVHPVWAKRVAVHVWMAHIIWKHFQQGEVVLFPDAHPISSGLQC